MDGMDGVAGTPIDIRKGLVKILLELFVSRVSLVEVIDDPGSILLHERQRGNSGLCLRIEELLDCSLSREEDHGKDRCL